MVKEFRKAMLVALAVAAVLAACAPAQSTPQQVEFQVGTSVAMTVAAQNFVSTASAATLTAQAPQPTATVSPTTIPLSLPSPAPAFATATPFVVVPAGGGGTGGSTGGSAGTPDYACSWTSSPPDLTRFKPGDPFDVKFTITNSGTKAWVAGKDFTFIGDTLFTTVSFVELPALQPGHHLSFSFDANAPMAKGRYAEQWKVQGIPGCYPLVVIIVGKPGDP